MYATETSFAAQRKAFGSASRRASLNPSSVAWRRPSHLHPPGSHLQRGIRLSFSTNASAPTKPTIHDVFESRTGTWQYVIADPSTLTAVILDPVLDYDPATQTITTQSADALLSLVKQHEYKIDRILETHVHADHLTAASYIQSRIAQDQGYRPPIGIGKRIKQVQQLFGRRYGIPPKEHEGVFDTLFDDDETFAIGSLNAMAIHLPGHTPDHLGYKIGGMTVAEHTARLCLVEIITLTETVR